MSAVLLEAPPPWRQQSAASGHSAPCCSCRLRRKEQLMSKICSYKMSCGVPARVLLLGPVGSGKSNFISSVQSIFSGRVLNHAMVGSSPTGFTKKVGQNQSTLRTFTINGKKGEGPTALSMCDVMGLREREGTGINFDDILAVIKGHAPEGHKFCPSRPLHPGTAGYREDPGVNDRVHCVVFVLDATRLDSYWLGLRGTFQRLREHISDLGVHQVAVLTHIDKACALTASDVKDVYKSVTIQRKRLSQRIHKDVLLLSAVDNIQEYADLYFQDQASKDLGPCGNTPTREFIG
ncbi:Interferon-induced protein 44 [Merluccius polli]|uniref:Interferon-induced protein 44 n=1 Tax=Merluccius polli TaxID=89951 RepID=A0AA47LZJ4_MERPO|nr:Interferon-induced protein 44 [Merluccius polli]